MNEKTFFEKRKIRCIDHGFSTESVTVYWRDLEDFCYACGVGKDMLRRWGRMCILPGRYIVGLWSARCDALVEFIKLVEIHGKKAREHLAKNLGSETWR
jgi:hypothetical protein